MFGENLKAMRKAKGYTQEESAIKINVVRQTVSKWESGYRFQTLMCCLKLQKYWIQRSAFCLEKR